MKFILIAYVVPLMTCLIYSWYCQITSSTQDYDNSVQFGYISFVPVANCFGATIVILILVGAIGIGLVNLPLFLKRINHDRYKRTV